MSFITLRSTGTAQKAAQLHVRPHRRRMLNILRVAGPTELRDETLRNRAVRAHSGRSQEFVARVSGEEAGFLSYEDWSDRASAFVFEIFVLHSYRRQRIGSALLSHAESYALELNCERIRLKPHALDQEPDLSRLKGWYARLGYREAQDDPADMEKMLWRHSAAY